MKAGGNGATEADAETIRVLRSAIRESGGQAALADLYGHIAIEEAARFLGTTKGELYNLTARRAIPFIRWSKRGVRFRRIDLIRWQEARLRPAAG